MKHRSLMVAALALLIAVGGMGVVYGAWTTTLSVNGTVSTSAVSAVWLNEGGYNPDQGVSCASTGLSADATVISIAVSGLTPGAKCVAHVTVKNTSVAPVNAAMGVPVVTQGGTPVAGVLEITQTEPFSTIVGFSGTDQGDITIALATSVGPETQNQSYVISIPVVVTQ